MECPHCRKHIKGNRGRCDYCGGEIKKTFFGKLWALLFGKRISKEQFFKSIESEKFTRIRSPEELELYIEYKTKDEEVAVIVRDVLEHAGKDALIAVKRGGSGDPYRIEYSSGKLPPKMSAEETDRRRKELEDRFSDGDMSLEEEGKLKEGLLHLTRNYVIIWINTVSEDVFEDKRQLIMSAFRAVAESVTGNSIR